MSVISLLEIFVFLKRKKREREGGKRRSTGTKDKGETIDISDAIILLVGRFQGRWREGSTVWAGQTIAIKDSSIVENLPRWSKPGKTELLSLLPSFSPSFSLQIFAGNYTPAKLISIYDFVVWNPPAMDRASRSVLLRFYNNWKNCVSRPTSRPLFPAYITSDIGCFPPFFFFFFVRRVSRYRSPPLERRYYFR